MPGRTCMLAARMSSACKRSDRNFEFFTVLRLRHSTMTVSVCPGCARSVARTRLVRNDSRRTRRIVLRRTAVCWRLTAKPTWMGLEVPVICCGTVRYSNRTVPTEMLDASLRPCANSGRMSRWRFRRAARGHASGVQGTLLAYVTVTHRQRATTFLAAPGE